MRSVLVLFFLFCCGLVYAQSYKNTRIPLKERDAYQDNNITQGARFLIDDNINTEFNPSHPSMHLIGNPHDVIFDLADYAPCTINSIIYYDAHGNGFNTKFILVGAVDGKEVEVGTYTGDQYMVERTIVIPAAKRAVVSKFILRAAGGGPQYPKYIKLIGDFTLHKDPTWKKRHQPLKNFLGVNAHPWDFTYSAGPDRDAIWQPKYDAFKELNLTSVRMYADAYANKDSMGKYAFNPELRGFEVETFFKQIRRDHPGFITHMCYQNQALPIKKTWDAAGKQSHLNIDYKNNNKRESFDTYYSLAEDCYVMAARGGKNKKVSDYPVYQSGRNYEKQNQLIKGGNFYDIGEPMNEPNAFWKGYDGYLNGKQLFRAWSMCYDGHKKRYPNVGFKNADSSFKMSASGLATDRIDLMRSVFEESKKYRGLTRDGNVDLPFDVMQLHCYSSAGGQHSGSAGGLPPEIGMFPQLREWVWFSNKFASGKEIWLGEWGWDVHPGSPLNAPTYATYTAEQTRANWAIRALLGFSEIGIDRAQWYRLYQDYIVNDKGGPNHTYDNDPQQFSTMALLRQNNDEGTKISRTLVGDYFKQLSEYGDYSFSSKMNTGDSSVYCYTFKNGNKKMIAVWAVEKMRMENGRPRFEEKKGKIEIPLNSNANIFIREFDTDGKGKLKRKQSSSNTKKLVVEYSATPMLIEIVE